MAEDVKGTAVLEEAVARVLELQSKYGMDQETMLIYMCSVNLTSILNLIGKRYHGSSSGYIQSPVTAPTTVPAPAPVSATGGNPSPNDLAGMLTSLLGGQGGSGGQGFNPAALMNLLGSLSGGQGGQGLNPAMLMSLLSALGGQNMDLGNLMNMLAGLMGTGSKNNTKTESSKGKPAASKDASNAAGAAKNDQGGEKQTVREMPKIMKWDNLDQRKRAQS
ncbi:hypothetical protein L9W92_13100 [Pelotomaculum terephthalicicum JT]|uniref:hypothetical protein n=1 Tax=Pelotomaculum terephthalicicum TaxID=206393 RepID=UPI0009CD6BA8|nr:hypothetical protein [Pelotomaculum terephthalicicum]MCG9968972.1 hypothetical protein [Pelotomaculum terephthalicicum JT]OPY63300.1 MAG: hypothetical protein A4E56_00650 [Pelotomaculum sp. PtaU1.Bin065]